MQSALTASLLGYNDIASQPGNLWISCLSIVIRGSGRTEVSKYVSPVKWYWYVTPVSKKLGITAMMSWLTESQTHWMV